MPRDSQGTFTNVRNWISDDNAGIGIDSDKHQSVDDDQATALTDSLDRQGRGGMQADLAMGNNKIEGLAAGAVQNDAPTVRQSQQGFNFGTDIGAADAYSVNLSPAIAAYTAGLRVGFLAANTNTGASTLLVNGVVAAPAIQWQGNALVAGDITAGELVVVEYDGTVFRMLSQPTLLPIDKGGTGAGTAANARTNLDVYSKAEVDALVGAVTTVPVGTVIDCAGAIPTGYLACVGETISDTGNGGTYAGSQYETLFEYLKVAGWGNAGTENWASDTVNLPNFAAGASGVQAGTGFTAGTEGGAKEKTIAEANLPAHTHGVGTLATNTTGDHTHNTDQGSGSASVSAYKRETTFGTVSQNVPTTSAGSHAHTISGDTGSTGSGTALDVMNPYSVITKAIKF